MTTTLDTSVKPAVTAQNLSKTYGTGEATVHALNNVTVSFEQGKFTAIWDLPAPVNLPLCRLWQP